MPGIFGLITTRPRQGAEAELLRMLEVVCHEPFYTSGTWVDEASGIYVGWVARKGSFGDGMPLSNERGDVLVFAGEEFPEPGTRQRLRARGHRLEEEGPSYLVHLSEENPQFLAGLNGRFHGLLAEGGRGTGILFNDRYGMQRLYYHEAKDALYFAAEAKAILTVRPELRRIDPRGLGEFIACGSVMNDRTLFPGIHVLPGGSAWTIRRGTVEAKRAYFDRAAWEGQPPLTPEAFYRRLRDVFARNLPRYFDGPEPVGMSLTGGLDTRMIMAWQNRAPKSLPCYTFGGPYRECHDVRVAREVAAAAGQPHQVIGVGEEFLSGFARYAERAVYLTEGCLEVSHTADLYVSERARDIAPVRLTGNYGGEVLRRVPTLRPRHPFPGLFTSDVVAAAGPMADTLDGLRSGHPLAFAVFRQTPWHHYGLLALEESQLAVRTPFLDNDLVAAAFAAPAAALASEDVCRRLILDGAPALAHIPTDRATGGRRGRLTGGLAPRLREFSRKAEYAYDYGMPQAVARVDHALRGLHLERLFLGRHKFCHYRIWYRDRLRGYVQDMLLDPRTLARPYLLRTGVEAMVANHLGGRRNHTAGIHTVLTLELLHRLFIDSPR